jgi:hypothetical protein
MKLFGGTERKLNSDDWMAIASFLGIVVVVVWQALR